MGSIEVICGGMFSGKTEEMIRRMRRATIGGKKVFLGKASKDTRYDNEQVVTHNMDRMDSVPISSVDELYQAIGDADVIGIDEVQFFTEEFIEAFENLANEGRRVILSGLDMDYAGIPFGLMPLLLARANRVSKLKAVCIQCGQDASYSYRLNNDSNQVMLGSTDSYEARCRACFKDGMKS